MKSTNKHVSVSIPVEVHDALQAYRWANQIDKFTDVLREALTDFAYRECGLPESVEDSPEA